MNFSTNAHCCRQKENIPPSSKTDASQVQRAKQRTALGVLSENEHHSSSLSQVFKEGVKILFPLRKAKRIMLTPLFYREANFPNTVGSQAVLGSPSSVVSPVLAVMFMLKRPVKLFLQLLAKKLFQTAAVKKVPPCKMKTWDSYWTWVQVSSSYCYNIFHCFDFLTVLLFTLEGSCKDASMQSEPGESLTSEEGLCVSEYAEDIHWHLRESEVRNYPNSLRHFFQVPVFSQH